MKHNSSASQAAFQAAGPFGQSHGYVIGDLEVAMSAFYSRGAAKRRLPRNA